MSCNILSFTAEIAPVIVCSIATGACLGAAIVHHLQARKMRWLAEGVAIMLRGAGAPDEHVERWEQIANEPLAPFWSLKP